MSSFTFVSWQPPLVLLCLRLGSRLLRELAPEEEFTVSVLSDDQTALARHYADPHRVHGELDIPADPLSMDPLDGCLGILDCRVTRTILAGDHAIVLAQVESVAAGDGGAPLLYFDGQLHSGRIGA